MRIFYIHYIIIIFFLSGCAAVKSPQRMEDCRLDNPLLYGFNEVIDFQGIQPGDIDKATTSALKDADKILVLDKGKIVESGTHSELCNLENGVYNKLSKFQSFIQ